MSSAETTEQTVIGAIVAYLRERRLQPGDRLPSERALAERLGVGRNTIREALSTLTTLRLVESRPQSGLYLRNVEEESSFEALVMLSGMGATPSRAEVRDTMEVRAHLEVLAARLACERRTDSDLDRLEQLLTRSEEVLANGGDFAACDTAFHIALVNATHNAVLVKVLHAFYQFTAERRAAVLKDRTQAAKSVTEHRQMVHSVRARDSAKACEQALAHMDRAKAYWSNVLGAEG